MTRRKKPNTTQHPNRPEVRTHARFGVVTAWFRVPAMWSALADRLDTMDSPWLWCGAAGTGEEAWTAAFIAADAGGTVYASDISAKHVSRAIVGTYPATTVRAGVPEAILEEFTTPSVGTLEVPQRLRHLVTFGVHDVGDGVPGAFDVAILRNMWRFLTPDAVAHLAEDLARTLPPHGLVCIGGADLYDQETTRSDTPPETWQESALLDPLREHFTEADDHPMIWERRGVNR